MPNSKDTEKPTDTGLQCLVMLPRYHQVAAGFDQIRHQFGSRDGLLNNEYLIRTARYLKLKARLSQSSCVSTGTVLTGTDLFNLAKAGGRFDYAKDGKVDSAQFTSSYCATRS